MIVQHAGSMFSHRFKYSIARRLKYKNICQVIKMDADIGYQATILQNEK
jgi:hypothetical protein